MSTLPAELPQVLARNGRPEDQDFAPDELLFRRYRADHYVGGQFSNLGLKFPRQSVNRQKYCEPLDVLLSETNEFQGWGVLSFHVQDLPPEFPPLPTQSHRYRFFPRHVPLENNYSHSEIWVDRLENTGQYVEPGSGVKKLFRAYLSQRVIVVKQATG